MENYVFFGRFDLTWASGGFIIGFVKGSSTLARSTQGKKQEQVYEQKAFAASRPCIGFETAETCKKRASMFMQNGEDKVMCAISQDKGHVRVFGRIYNPKLCRMSCLIAILKIEYWAFRAPFACTCRGQRLLAQKCMVSIKK